jgi:tetratricopeptide (TPR) repeat protein
MSDESGRRPAQLHAAGRQAYNIGMFDEALRLYDDALRLDPTNARIWYDKGNVLRNWGRMLPGPAPSRHVEAILCYKRAVSLDPNFGDAWGNMGVAFGVLNDHGQALVCFTKALELQPDDNHWRQMRTVALQKLERERESS